LREATDMTEAVMPPSLETAVSHWLKLVGIEILAAIVIVIGLAWSTYLFLRRQMAEEYMTPIRSASIDPSCLALRSWSRQTSSKPSRSSPA
jgi:hypothetical protein